MKPDFGRIITAGVLATTVMTLLMYQVASWVFGGPMDIAGMLGAILDVSWNAGMIFHLLLGSVVFPLTYAGLYSWLRGHPWQRGLAFELVLWLLAEAVVMPLAGAGFFHAIQGGLVAATFSLAGHVAYGSLLGALAGETSLVRTPMRSSYPRPEVLRRPGTHQP
jgi:hypothetical protein